MKEPVRLWADPEAPADLRVDLHRAAKAEAAFDADAGLARLLVAVTATAGAAAAKTAAEASAAGAAKAATTSGAAASKGLALLLGKGAYWALAAVGTAGVVAAVSIGRGGDPPSPAPAAPTVIAAAPAAAPQAPPRADRPPEVAPSAEPTASARAEQPAAPSAPSARAPIATASAPRSLLAEEVKQLSSMRERVGDRPADVLAEADRSARAFPGGALAQEREALAIEALLRLDRRDEAQARAAAFLARYPTSPLAPRMRALAGR